MWTPNDFLIYTKPTYLFHDQCWKQSNWRMLLCPYYPSQASYYRLQLGSKLRASFPCFLTYSFDTPSAFHVTTGNISLATMTSNSSRKFPMSILTTVMDIMVGLRDNIEKYQKYSKYHNCTTSLSIKLNLLLVWS